MSSQHLEGQASTTGTSSPSLQASLHAATRSKHANLNKTITSRLPLCLPPHASSPLPYHLGMLAFATIYGHLECSIVRSTQESSKTLGVDGRHIQIVRKLFTEGLGRTQQLAHDSTVLRKRLARSVHVSAVILEEIEEKVQNQARLLTEHLQERFDSRPYLILAYAWAMYLALFNGGRWLLKQLESAGPGFWLEDSVQPQGVDVLSFWHFDAATPQDPNADLLKNAFKNNFDSASVLLTDEETLEVVQEGAAVFDLCSELIGLLDTSLQELEQASMANGRCDNISSDQQRTLAAWQILQSSLLAPAHQFMRRIWTRPFEGEVRSSDG